MQKLEYRVQFTTPAFMGNAEQVGQWRTPPLKAQLRQWWRVAYAAERGFNIDIQAMREEEGKLFGHAWLENDRKHNGDKVSGRKSRVRLALETIDGQEGNPWATGTQTGVTPMSTGLETSYAWFGLIKRGGGAPDKSAISAGDSAESVRRFKVAAPDECAPRVEEAIRLMDAFGLLGSRSRGGWGSLQVTENCTPLTRDEWPHYARELDQCLDTDWAMSLAADRRGPCIWESTDGYSSWDKIMGAMAGERKRVRTSLPADQRPALGFAKGGRMPSPLRWKVYVRPDGKLGIRAFAMPHQLPGDSKTVSKHELRKAWETVIEQLDSSRLLGQRH